MLVRLIAFAAAALAFVAAAQADWTAKQRSDWYAGCIDIPRRPDSGQAPLPYLKAYCACAASAFAKAYPYDATTHGIPDKDNDDSQRLLKACGKRACAQLGPKC